jgi:hypothetical protein
MHGKVPFNVANEALFERTNERPISIVTQENITVVRRMIKDGSQFICRITRSTLNSGMATIT